MECGARVQASRLAAGGVTPGKRVVSRQPTKMRPEVSLSRGPEHLYGQLLEPCSYSHRPVW